MELCDKYLHELIKIDPTMNDFFLFDNYLHLKGVLPDIYSEKHYQKLHTLDIKYQKILEKKNPLTLYDRILLRDIKHNIHMEMKYEIYMYMPINLNENIIVDYVTECSGNGLYIFEKRKDYLDFMLRLKTLPIITDEIIQKMKSGMDKNICLPRKTVDKMIETMTDILKHSLYENKNKRKPKEWNIHVTKYLVESLKKLNTFLIDEYYPFTKDNQLGLSQYKGGKAAYKKIIQYKTLNKIHPDMIIKLGFSELKRLMKEKKRLSKVLGLDDIDAEVKKDVFSNKKSILTSLKKIQTNQQKLIYPKYFHGQFHDKDLYKIKSITMENKRYFAYYVSGDLKGKKKGTFYINTFIPETVNKNELYVLSLHEGIPGHHLQILKQNRLKTPDYLKLGDDSYSEGWALYCENLGDYKDDFQYYYKLQYEILRSLRLIIDPGIHYFGWDYQKCSNLLKDYLPNYTEKQIDKAILRYMNDPGQAITYKIGEKVFLHTIHKLIEKGHNIKDIHEQILNAGPMPIEFLVDHLN